MNIKPPKHDVVHTAIPTHDKEQAKHFYETLLGGKVAREYDDRVTFALFAHQLVCHLDQEYAPAANAENPLCNVYPRHFGMTFLDESEIRRIHKILSESNWQYLQPLMTRFGNLPERHLTFFVADPTHNIVEFKWYQDARYAY